MIFFLFSCKKKNGLLDAISGSFVNVVSPMGTCGGGFLSYGNKKYLVSAAHCDHKDIILFDGENFFYEDLKIVLNDKESDLLIYETSNKKIKRKILKYREEKADLLDEVYYLCSPNGLPPVMIQGHIARKEEGFYVLQAFAWNGCSGSLVFSSSGNAIGVISAIMLSDIAGLPLENMVIVSTLNKKNFGR